MGQHFRIAADLLADVDAIVAASPKRGCRPRRSRQEEAGRLAEEGLSAAEIAARLDSDEDTVNGWLSRRLPRAAGVAHERTRP